jgi:hypothetical protein
MKTIGFIPLPIGFDILTICFAVLTIVWLSEPCSLHSRRVFSSPRQSSLESRRFLRGGNALRLPDADFFLTVMPKRRKSSLPQNLSSHSENL